MTFAILATGPSLTPEQVERVRHLRVIAVSDAYRLAPWADCLVSADTAWWRHHRPEFAGRRFSQEASGTEQVPGVPQGTNSGALAIKVARHLGARRIVLLGFDGHGSHFFGPHPAGLKNTSDERRKIHMAQHRIEAEECRRLGVEVWNCSPETAIPYYPKASLDSCLNALEASGGK